MIGTANANFSISTIAQAPTPKEMAILQRMDGVVGGVREIEQRLRVFTARLNAEGVAGTEAAMPSRAGLTGALTDTEQSIRECINLLSALSEAF